jgi:hypothetical protein
MNRALRLPKNLTYTVIGCAVVGAIACSGTTSPSQPGADAAIDSTTGDSAIAEAASDSPARDDAAGDAGIDAIAIADANDAEACSQDYFCGPSVPDASCPGFVCTPPECDYDAGCEVFA